PATRAGRAPARDASAPADLVSWWRAENNAEDELGANPGMERGGVSYTDGIVGRAFHLAGTGYIEVNSSASLEPAALTVMAWVRGGQPEYPGTYFLAKGAYACNSNSSYAVYTRPDAP